MSSHNSHRTRTARIKRLVQFHLFKLVFSFRSEVEVYSLFSSAPATVRSALSFALFSAYGVWFFSGFISGCVVYFWMFETIWGIA